MSAEQQQIEADFVVVGGYAVAARLSEDPETRVLLLKGLARSSLHFNTARCGRLTSQPRFAWQTR